MRLILAILLILLLCFVAGLYLPWWSIAIISFLVSLFIPQTLFHGFIAGFLGVFILWGLLAFWIDVKNDSILSEKIAQLFPLGGSSELLILVTALIGALVGGFASMAGTSLRTGTNK